MLSSSPVSAFLAAPVASTTELGDVMATIISFETSSRRFESEKANGFESETPATTAFWLPDECRRGDRILYFVGGRLNLYVGSGRVESDWKVGRSGPWKGQWYCLTGPVRLFREPVPGRDVERVTGFSVPRDAIRLTNSRLGSDVWRAAHGQPLIRIESAVEGAATESRSRQRNPRLRRTALELANGVCEVCHVNFRAVGGGLGEHCLVVHHTKQLKDTDQPVETRVRDLAVVCANCHMMIHSNRLKAISPSALRRKLGLAPTKSR